MIFPPTRVTRCVCIEQGYLASGTVFRMFDAYTDDDDEFLLLTDAASQLK